MVCGIGRKMYLCGRSMKKADNLLYGLGESQWLKANLLFTVTTIDVQNAPLTRCAGTWTIFIQKKMVSQLRRDKMDKSNIGIYTWGVFIGILIASAFWLGWYS